MVLECRISQKTTTRMLGFVKTELLRKRATLVTARETTARMARVGNNSCCSLPQSYWKGPSGRIVYYPPYPQEGE